MYCVRAKKFKWKFTTLSAVPFLILQKYNFVHLDVVRHHMRSTVIALLFSSCMTNVFNSSLMPFFCHGDSSWKNSIKRFFFERLVTISAKSNLMSIGMVYHDYTEVKMVKYFVDAYLQNLCVNKIPSITYDQSQGFSSRAFPKESLIVRFWLWHKALDWEWHD